MISTPESFWITAHDIFRDKPDTFPVQEAIDVISKAYKLETGKNISEYLAWRIDRIEQLSKETTA